MRLSSGDVCAGEHLERQNLYPPVSPCPSGWLRDRIALLWLSSPVQAIARVRQRVQQGGHNVPAVDIRRRFKRSLAHLADDYLPLADRWIVWDSRSLPAKRLAISSDNDIDMVRELIGV